MNYPTLTPENTNRDFIDVFGGYNHNYRINENEFFDMNNMTSSCFPLLASRPKRGEVPVDERVTQSPYGLLYCSELYVARFHTPYGTPLLTVYRNGNYLTEFLGEEFVIDAPVKRKLVMMGAYIIIFPDKLFVNVNDASDSGKIEEEFQTSETVIVQACTSDGVPITFNHLGEEAPENPLDGDIWLDTSETKAVFKKWFASNATWQSVIANNVLITGEDIDTTKFKEKDGVRISGFTNEKLTGLNATSILHKVVDNGLVLSTILDMNSLENDIELTQYPVKSYENLPSLQKSNVTVYCKENFYENYFIDFDFTNSLYGNSPVNCTSSEEAESNTDSKSAEYPYTVVLHLNKLFSYNKKDKNLWAQNLRNINRFEVNDQITFARKMPEAMNLKMVIESKNRLWGCGFGQNEKGEYVNEIYASKLGDFKNWECFEGLSTDSYVASCGTDGDWTGAINYLGVPVFFKENYIHTVNGSFPAQFQISSIPARGVQQGSESSLAVIDETLYYMSLDGVCAYNGSLPTKISDAFGENQYNSAIAVGYKGKYYINFIDDNSNYIMMVYDTKRGLWHKEDGIELLDLCAVKNDIYYLDNVRSMRSLFGTGGQDSNPVEWFVETGKFGLSQPDSKYISRINIRLSLEKSSKMFASIQYDSSGVWEKLCSIFSRNISPFTLPIKPKRCDHFQLKLEGKGGVKIYSIAKTIEQGSDR